MATDTWKRGRITHYMNRARQTLESSGVLLAHGDYPGAMNRAYYAMFYAANALIATKGLERSKHSGVMAAFRQHFVKTGMIEPEYSDFLGGAMQERHAGDYEVQEFRREAAARHLEHAAKFIQRIEEIIANMEGME